MREAQRMADLMGGELADARARARNRIVGRAAAALAGARQPSSNQAIPLHAERAERDVSFQLFAGTGIDDAATVGPAAGRAMHPPG